MPTPTDNYIIARDASEAERLDLQHRLVLSCQGYHLHPCISLSQNARIAELATGTAIFLREVATTYPSAECHGFDLSDSMFPTQESLPANVKLHAPVDIKKPFEQRWIGYFDVVHIRFVEAAMRKEEWATTLKNVVSLLKPGGWLQWVEDDRAHSVRHGVRQIAPLGAVHNTAGAFRPQRIEFLGRFTGLLMPQERAESMTYGYMNLDLLMADPNVGDLEQVGVDAFAIDRQDDGGELRREWVRMGIAAVWSMLKAREATGERLTDLSLEQIAEEFEKDIERSGHWLTKVAVFTGRNRA